MCVKRHRLILAKREAKAVTEADTEALDWWYDLEEDFDLLCFKAWNAVIYQVSFVCTATMPLHGCNAGKHCTPTILCCLCQLIAVW